jgi:ureidoglycolate hydrolase
MQRHYNVTQAFLPPGNGASVTVFAPTTDPRDPKAVPRPADMRALYMDGAQGIMMWKGTWHTGRGRAETP